LDAAVAEVNPSVSDGGGFGGVGSQKDGGAISDCGIPNQFKDLGAAHTVEIAGGLVGNQDLRGMNEGASDGDALHLTSGELEREAGDSVLQADPLEPFDGRFTATPAAGEKKRQSNIFQDGEGGKELEKLKNEANPVAAESCEIGVREGRRRAAVDQDFTGCRKVHGAGEVQERGFPAAGAAKESGDGSGFGGQGDVMQHSDGLATVGIDFGDSAEFEARSGHRSPL
jgi:hypothetical protein